MAESFGFSSNTEGRSHMSELLKEQGRRVQSLQSMAHTSRPKQEIDQACYRGENETDANAHKSLQPVPHLEIHTGKPIRLKVKVHIPVKDHPNFNFVGKLLGPKGSSLKQLQEATQTKMAILGRGSMRDKQKEEELRLQDDPKYNHLREDLHVEITAFAPPAEAYHRIAAALVEVKRFLVPDYFDDIRQKQLRELGVFSGKSKQKSAEGNNHGSPVYDSEDPSAILETGSPTVFSYPTSVKRECLLRHHPLSQKKYTSIVDDNKEHTTDLPYGRGPRRYLQPEACNGICISRDDHSVDHEHIHENSMFNMYGNSYNQESTANTGNAAYGDEYGITATYEEFSDEQCIPPQMLHSSVPAPRNPATFRYARFQNHPYNLQPRYH